MWQYTYVLKSFKYSMIPGWLLQYVLSPSEILYNPLKKKLNSNDILRGIGKNIKRFTFFVQLQTFCMC